LLLSELGQPLSAEIEIVALQAGDEVLAARLIPSKGFYRAVPEMDRALSGIQFTLLNPPR
jgi:Tfp pilus assembly protein FimV